MHLSFATIRAVAAVLRGDIPLGQTSQLSRYRTHNQLTEFFRDDLRLPVELDTGGSRQDRAEAVLKNCTDDATRRRIVEAAVRPVDYVQSGFDVGVAVEYLNESLGHDGLRLRSNGKTYALFATSGVALPGPEALLDILSEAYVQELADKSTGRLSSGDVEGAITAARTLLEAVLFELELALLGTRSEFGGDLQKHFKHVAKALNLDDERKDLDDGYKQVVRGLVSAVNGMAPLRNKVSDSHARVRKPAPHHGQLVVNASKTVALFLVQSFLAQRAGGKFVPPQTAG